MAITVELETQTFTKSDVGKIVPMTLERADGEPYTEDMLILAVDENHIDVIAVSQDKP